MPFVLTNAHEEFMNLIYCVFHDFLHRFVIVFVDDILIYSRSEEEHEEHLRIVLKILNMEKLYTKFKKCKFWLERVVFPIHVIIAQGTEVDPSKVEGILNSARPTSVRKICSFSSLAEYCRRFIEEFSKIYRPL